MAISVRARARVSWHSHGYLVGVDCWWGAHCYAVDQPSWRPGNCPWQYVVAVVGVDRGVLSRFEVRGSSTITARIELPAVRLVVDWPWRRELGGWWGVHSHVRYAFEVLSTD